MYKSSTGRKESCIDKHDRKKASSGNFKSVDANKNIKSAYGKRLEEKGQKFGRPQNEYHRPYKPTKVNPQGFVKRVHFNTNKIVSPLGKLK